MQLTRRALVKGTGATGIAALLGGLFPEVAAAKSPAVKPTSKLGKEVIATARADRRTTAVLAKYATYNFDWDAASATLDDDVARVGVIGRGKAGRSGAVLVNVYINRQTSSVMFVQHTAIVKNPSQNAGQAQMAVAFDAAEPVWLGSLTSSGDAAPKKGYPSLQALRSMKQPASCRSKVSTVCQYAADGDSILACAVLVETGPGAIACGVALLIISHYGCHKLQSMICG